MSITKKMQVFARNNFLKLEIPNTKTDVKREDIERMNEGAIISSNQNVLFSSNQNAGILTNQNEVDVNDMIFDINVWMKLGKYIYDRDDKIINGNQ